MKKNIDDIFNEKFKQAEITPPEEIWNNISAQLPFKKSKKRIIPIWYLMAGTAAALAIIVFLFNYNQSPILNKKITNTPGNNINIDNTSDESKIQILDLAPILEQKNDVVQSNKQENESLKTKESQTNNISEMNAQVNEAKTSIVSNYAKENELKNLEMVSRQEKSLSTDYELSQIIHNEVEIVANDSILLLENTIASANDIEETFFNTNEVEKSFKTPISKRLSVTTTAGALYFNNLGDGSGIDEQFANNNATSEITSSYGVNFGYQISQKVKLRTGISQINLVNNTQNVEYSSLINSRALGRQDLNNSPTYSNNPITNNLISFAGKVNQNLGFIEVPSEIEYLLIDKKLGINLIGGFSTLFLNKNEISINSENSNTDLGKANNLNEISFTANAGFGLNYKISPQFHFNLEPIFKYQLNTFKETKDFKPYYFGMYSGFSFKF
ncbi:hypothetical protein BC962_1135 [Gillisia mitskevichiae]|uniref:Outer membrane protein with beta-barrel domain n=1 Tax=Gillisia mitskevichiae TaxID=270921 RepID=A0A495Q034_9FLAO|nr:hypothetical protein [Gillisia mitskevichiae]RKS56156.1 hypothetical protein BC962_1135 [Gillisia mitskevichiae]